MALALPPTMRILRSVSLLALASSALSAQAVTISFGDLFLPGYTSGTPFTTRAVSNLGPLAQNAVLSFNFVSGGGTYQIDLRTTITDPTGARTYLPLPGAGYGSGPYSGAIQFGSLTPGSGAYSITFVNTYNTRFDVALTNIRLDVTPLSTSAVPGPMAALPFALIALRRRKRA